MALTVQERVAKHRSLKAATEFRNTYLKGAIRATPEEFIEAKLRELQAKVNGLVIRFHYALTNPFYDGLQDLDNDDDHYDVNDMFLLWKEIDDSLNDDS